MYSLSPLWWRWWYYPTPSERWGRRRTPRRPSSRATPQGLDHRSRIEREEPKIDLRKGSEAGQSRRRWLRFCRGCPQALQAEFSFRWSCEDMRIKEDCGHGSEDGKAHSKWGEKGAVPPKRLRGLGSSDGSGRCDVSNCGIGDNGLWQRLGEKGLGSRQWAERHQLWQVNPLWISSRWPCCKARLMLFYGCYSRQ